VNYNCIYRKRSRLKLESRKQAKQTIGRLPLHLEISVNCRLLLDLYVAPGSVCCSWICMLLLDLYVAPGSVCCFWIFKWGSSFRNVIASTGACTFGSIDIKRFINPALLDWLSQVEFLWNTSLGDVSIMKLPLELKLFSKYYPYMIRSFLISKLFELSNIILLLSPHSANLEAAAKAWTKMGSGGLYLDNKSRVGIASTNVGSQGYGCRVAISGWTRSFTCEFSHSSWR